MISVTVVVVHISFFFLLETIIVIARVTQQSRLPSQTLSAKRATHNHPINTINDLWIFLERHNTFIYSHRVERWSNNEPLPSPTTTAYTHIRIWSIHTDFTALIRSPCWFSNCCARSQSTHSSPLFLFGSFFLPSLLTNRSGEGYFVIICICK